MKILTPIYDLSYAKKAIRSNNVLPIFNVNDGPGTSLDKEWLKIISKCSQPYAFYIDLVTWTGKKSQFKKWGQIQAEVNMWIKLYGKPDYIFYDDLQKEFSEINNGIKSTGIKAIGNPGSGYTEKAFSTYEILVTFESEDYSKYKKTSLEEARASRCAHMAINQKDLGKAVQKANSMNVGYFFSTDLSEVENPYRRLPSYWDKLILS